MKIKIDIDKNITLAQQHSIAELIRTRSPRDTIIIMDSDGSIPGHSLSLYDHKNPPRHIDENGAIK